MALGSWHLAERPPVGRTVASVPSAGHAMGKDKHEGCTVHVGGVTSLMEQEQRLREFCEDSFGPVHAVTVRIRHDVPGKTSWALVTFESKPCASQMITAMGPTVVVDTKLPGHEDETVFALREKARLQAQYLAERKLNMEHNRQEELIIRVLGPVRRVDRLQVMASAGSMGTVMRKHQEDVNRALELESRRVRAPHERYADAVLASRVRRDDQESGYLVVLKDEARQQDPTHRGWDVRVRPRDRMLDLMTKIRQRIDGMRDAEGIVRTDAEVQMGRKRRILTVRQMKHASTYLIRHRSAPLSASETFAVAMRFYLNDEAFKWSRGPQLNGVVIKVQRQFRARASLREAQERKFAAMRNSAAITVQCCWRVWISQQVYKTLAEPKSWVPPRVSALATETASPAKTTGNRWGMVRSAFGNKEQLQKELAQKRAKQEAKQEAARREMSAAARWDDLRKTILFQTAILSKVATGEATAALKYIRKAQSALGYQYRRQIQKVAEPAVSADRGDRAGLKMVANNKQAARKRASKRWRSAHVETTTKAKTVKAIKETARSDDRPARSRQPGQLNVLLDSVQKITEGYDAAKEQRLRAASLAKPTHRICPPPRPSPMSMANYVITGGDDSWNTPVTPPAPSSAKERALLIGGAPPSPRQRRAMLSVQQVLARRGYLTPRDLDASMSPHPPRSAACSSSSVGTPRTPSWIVREARAS